jgi:hypothetical protein
MSITAGGLSGECPTNGVSGPNTLSCGLAGRVANDRNTGGRESAIIEGSG